MTSFVANLKVNSIVSTTKIPFKTENIIRLKIVFVSFFFRFFFIMEPGFTKADNRNLPEVDSIMVGDFLRNNSDYCASESRNVKTSISARKSYGDDAIGYVQLRRDAEMCTIKCRVCPEHKVRSKMYAATMVVNEKERHIISAQCHDCTASKGGCKHSVAFVMWVHRRSEEPSSTDINCYWKKSKLAQVGSNIKYITTKELSARKRQHPTQPAIGSNILTQVLNEASRRGVTTCGLLNHINNRVEEHEKLSLHYLIIEHYDEGDCISFLNEISQYFTQKNIKIVEENTRAQYKNRLWYELRYGRITASKAFEISKCHTVDGSLVALIMGAKTPDTKAMRRGQELEVKVRAVVEKKLGKKIKECGLFISREHPYLAGSPDGICNNQFCIEIKCPTSEKTLKNYIKNNKVAEKYMAQIQIQMFVTNLKYCYFCVADYNFEVNQEVKMVLVTYDESLVKNYILSLYKFWAGNIYPILCDSTK